MLIKQSLFTSLIFALTLASLPALAQFEEGVDYRSIKSTIDRDINNLSELDDFSHIELFYWYGCDSCYQVDAALAAYLEENPHLNYRRTPLVLRPEWREQAYIQALMAQIPDTTAENILDIYRQCLTDCTVFSQFDSTEKWVLQRVDNGNKPNIDYDLIWQTQKNYQKRADILSISQVPTIIIKDTYKVDANQAKTAQRLLEIIDYLLAK
jgi:hypothetical protein